MQDRTLYSIQESRKLLVVIGTRRLISAEAIADLIERSTTTESPSRATVRRSKSPRQITLPLLSPSSVRARIGRSQS